MAATVLQFAARHLEFQNPLPFSGVFGALIRVPADTHPVANPSSWAAGSEEGSHLMAGILIVDDDDLTRGVIKRILELGNHTIFQVNNGQEALQVVSTAPIDLIITDILMPERDGLDVIAQVKGTHPWVK